MSIKKDNQIYKGYIKYVLPEKGFGYVRVPETREEFYFRIHNSQSIIVKDLRVQFKLKETRQGLVAIELEVLSVT